MRFCACDLMRVGVVQRFMTQWAHKPPHTPGPTHSRNPEQLNPYQQQALADLCGGPKPNGIEEFDVEGPKPIEQCHACPPGDRCGDRKEPLKAKIELTVAPLECGSPCVGVADCIGFYISNTTVLEKMLVRFCAEKKWERKDVFFVVREKDADRLLIPEQSAVAQGLCNGSVIMAVRPYHPQPPCYNWKAPLLPEPPCSQSESSEPSSSSAPLLLSALD